jgi:hypothetical protein
MAGDVPQAYDGFQENSYGYIIERNLLAATCPERHQQLFIARRSLTGVRPRTIIFYADLFFLSLELPV